MTAFTRDEYITIRKCDRISSKSCAIPFLRLSDDKNSRFFYSLAARKFIKQKNDF
ncbi:hypothetical protein FDUTEX481_04776 [Tolypothrix sp. PCC 7601]|nr:hypothetical protein FDUTEX481_04776 [Tolypothrix sp. PCC 7601]